MAKNIFTLIICTYNRDRYLQQCLDALVQQTLPSKYYRIVVIDNNSKDDTAEVVRQYLPTMPNLEYYFESKQGLSHARNRGIEESDGDYLFFLDDDALLSPESLSHLWDYLSDHPQTLIVGGRAIIKYLIDKPGWVTPKVESWMGSYNYGDENIEVNRKTIGNRQVRLPIGCCFIVKRSLLDEMGGFDPTIGRLGKKMLAGEETLIGLKALDKEGSIVYLPQVYVDHMIEPAWVDQTFMLNKTFYYGLSDLRVQWLLDKGLFHILNYLGFRTLYLCKNLVDITICTLVNKGQKAYEARLLLNFHLGIASGLPALMQAFFQGRKKSHSEHSSTRSTPADATGLLGAAGI